ncbi:MAG: enoyl-CoA hydratase-related protein, partial [Stellaceae bacterium]
MAEGERVRFENADGIGVITIDNPPVNALSPGVPEGIVAGIERGNADPAIRAMVLLGAGRSFIAGADIRQFGTNRPRPVAGRRPYDILDASAKPVIAAIHGYALGGGFEIALACHYRIAVPSARVGLPEVLIGILPGGGGTQRLPRLIGPKAALDMITSGRHVPAPEAKELGLIDELVPEGGDLRAAAVAFARAHVDQRPLPRIRDRDDKLVEAKAEPGLFAAVRQRIARRARNQKAPYHCIAAVEAACTLPFDEGLKRERELFDELENAPEARALRYAFFAEREVARIPDIPRETPLRPIRTAAVVGAGTMGGGIAMSFAEFGFPVKILDA